MDAGRGETRHGAFQSGCTHVSGTEGLCRWNPLGRLWVALSFARVVLNENGGLVVSRVDGFLDKQEQPRGEVLMGLSVRFVVAPMLVAKHGRTFFRKS